MNKSLEFKTYEDGSTICGGFAPANETYWHKITESFDDKLDLYQFGKISPMEFAIFCERLIKSEPLFLDGYAHLGMMFMESNPVSASRWYKKGFELGTSMLPDGFAGQISWGDLDNRPFLRCHHGHILCLIQKKKFKQAVEEINKHLLWNEDDNIGIRYLLGELYIIAKDFESAKKIMEPNASGHPPYYYSLGLIAFLQKDYAKSITYFRHGILENPYLAEIITGRTNIIPHKFWHGSSLMYPDLAISFMDTIGHQLWERHEKAKIFLDWLFNCSMVLNERSEFIKCRELLQSEHDFKLRGNIRKIEEKLMEGITAETSQVLVRKIQTKDKECWPWEAEGVHSFRL